MPREDKLAEIDLGDGARGPVKLVSTSAFGDMTVHWSASGCGFGGFSLYFDKERGRMRCDSELMSKKFVAAALVHLINNCTDFDWEEEKKKVKTKLSIDDVNEIMGLPESADSSFFITPYQQKKLRNSNIVKCYFRIDDSDVMVAWLRIKNGEDVYDTLINIFDSKFDADTVVKAERWSWK